MAQQATTESGAGGQPELHRVDAWWTVLAIDPFATRLVRLVHSWRWVTPMRLTGLAHLLGVLTAVLFARGALVPAAVLYEVRFVLDCMDGKLARRRGATSAAGAYVDFVGDYLTTAANMVGLGLWLHWHEDTAILLALGPAVVFLAHMSVRLSSEMQGSMWRVADSMSSRYVTWMARRRLVPSPGRVDVEHGYLFVLPLVAVALGEPGALVVAAGVVSAYFAYVAIRFLDGGLTLARAKDAGAMEPSG